MISDRRRVERALVPGMLLAVVHHMQVHPQQFGDVVAALNRAVAEPGLDLTQERRHKLANRCRRLTTKAFVEADFYETEHNPGASIGKMYLAVALWLKGLFDRGAMEVGECDFVHAFDALSEAMSEHAELMDEMERSAVRAANRIRKFFEIEGYFLPNEQVPA